MTTDAYSVVKTGQGFEEILVKETGFWLASIYRSAGSLAPKTERTNSFGTN